MSKSLRRRARLISGGLITAAACFLPACRAKLAVSGHTVPSGATSTTPAGFPPSQDRVWTQTRGYFLLRFPAGAGVTADNLSLQNATTLEPLALDVALLAENSVRIFPSDPDNEGKIAYTDNNLRLGFAGDAEPGAIRETAAHLQDFPYFSVAPALSANGKQREEGFQGSVSTGIGTTVTNGATFLQAGSITILNL